MGVGKRIVAIAALAGVLLMAVAATADSAPQATPSGFVISRSPVAFPHGWLAGVAAASSTSVWAVGRVGDGSRDEPLVEHYDGRSWQVVAVPHPLGRLEAVNARGGAVWAVGDCRFKGAGWTTGALVERSAGSRWLRVPFPEKIALKINLTSVLVFSNTNVWVAGDYDNDGLAVVYRWNGKTWIKVDFPNAGSGQGDYASGLAGTLSTHVFVPEVTRNAGGDSSYLFRQQPNGVWATAGSASGDITAVSASSAENVWTVGSDVGIGVSNPWAARWNGSTYTHITVPNPSSNPYPTAVVTISPNNVWAVGYQEVGGGFTTLIEHYTGGASFTELASPNVHTNYNLLTAITAAPGDPSDLWAVGYANNQPLILRYEP